MKTQIDRPVYLAGAYSHEDEEVRQSRYEKHKQYLRYLINRKHIVYSPIVHFHPLAVEHGLPTDFQFWQQHNLSMLACCRKLFVIPNWEESTGTKAEIEYAKSSNILIKFL